MGLVFSVLVALLFFFVICRVFPCSSRVGSPVMLFFVLIAVRRANSAP